MDFNKKEYINNITTLIQNFWIDLSQSICSGRRVRKYPLNIQCNSGGSNNSLYPEVNENLEKVCKKVLGNRTPNSENIYAHNFFLTISDNGTLVKRILLESWQLTWEDKPYSSKYDNVSDQIANLLKAATLTSMCMPMHKLTLENLVEPFNCAFYTYHYCPKGAALGCALPGSFKKENVLVGTIRTKVSQVSLYVSYVPEIDLNDFADEVRAIEIVPISNKFKKESRGEFGSTPELQFIPDDILQLKNESDSVPVKHTTDQLEESTQSTRGSMLDVTCAFANGEDTMSEDMKQDILEGHRLSKLEEDLLESFHKTLSIEKLVEAKKAAEQGMLLNEKIGELLDSSAVLDSKLKKIAPKVNRCQSSPPTNSPFLAAPLVNEMLPEPLRPSPEAAQIAEVSKQLLEKNVATTAHGSATPGAKFYNVMAPFADENRAEDLASLYTMFKNAPDINFRATNELQDLEEQFVYFEGMKKKGQLLYEKIKRERREQEDGDMKD